MVGYGVMEIFVTVYGDVLSKGNSKDGNNNFFLRI